MHVATIHHRVGRIIAQHQVKQINVCQRALVLLVSRAHTSIAQHSFKLVDSDMALYLLRQTNLVKHRNQLLVQSLHVCFNCCRVCLMCLLVVKPVALLVDIGVQTRLDFVVRDMVDQRLDVFLPLNCLPVARVPAVQFQQLLGIQGSAN